MKNEDMMKYVVKSIRVIRKKKNISQMELCLRTGMSQSFLTGIETGKQEPSTMTLIRIASALEVNPRAFFPEDENTQSEAETKNQIKEEIISLLKIL